MSVFSVPLVRSAQRRTIDLTETQLKVLIEIEPLLRAAGLHLACPRCLAAGHGDRALVGGQNHPSMASFTVECPCTTRRGVNPAPRVVLPMS